MIGERVVVSTRDSDQLQASSTDTWRYAAVWLLGEGYLTNFAKPFWLTRPPRPQLAISQTSAPDALILGCARASRVSLCHEIPSDPRYRVATSRGRQTGWASPGTLPRPCRFCQMARWLAKSRRRSCHRRRQQGSLCTVSFLLTPCCLEEDASSGSRLHLCLLHPNRSRQDLLQGPIARTLSVQGKGQDPAGMLLFRVQSWVNHARDRWLSYPLVFCWDVVGECYRIPKVAPVAALATRAPRLPRAGALVKIGHTLAEEALARVPRRAAQPQPQHG